MFTVQEVRYERVLPTHNAATLQDSTEFNFVIPPRSDYFTRLNLLDEYIYGCRLARQSHSVYPIYFQFQLRCANVY